MAPNGTYQNALECLRSLRTRQTIKVAEMPHTPSSSLEVCLERLGHNRSAMGKLNIIQVSVSKHLSSVSVFVESIIRRTRPGWNTGIYTSSPDHQSPCDQIHINGKPISEPLFVGYFFHLWDCLSPNEPDSLNANKPDSLNANKPDSLNANKPNDIPEISLFLTLLALHIFIQENVNATIVEIDTQCSHDHLKGALSPIVVGLISLSSLSFYPWTSVKSLPIVILEEANGTGDSGTEELQLAVRRPDQIRELADVELGIPGPHEMENATFAVNITKTFFSTIDPCFKFAFSSPPLPSSFIVGLKKANVSGRG